MTLTKSVQFIPLVLWYFMFGVKNFIFRRKWINSVPICHIVATYCLVKSLQKKCFYVLGKLQRKHSVGRGLKDFIFQPYEFENLGFLTNTRWSVMRSKTQWVFYRDLGWWPGPQKAQFREITLAVGLCLALLKLGCPFFSYFMKWNWRPLRNFKVLAFWGQCRYHVQIYHKN